MIEHELRQRVDRLFDDEPQPDWLDVVGRTAAVGTKSARPRVGLRLGFGRRRRSAMPGTRALVAAGLVGAAIAAVPAFAFSSPLRNLVGMKSLPRPSLAATLVRAPARDSNPRPGTLITVTFTIAKPGEPAGAGVAHGSAFAVASFRENSSQQIQLLLTQAYGRDGHYSAQIRWPGGRVVSIRIAGWVNVSPTEALTADGGVWLDIPIVNDPYPHLSAPRNAQP